MKEDRVSSTTGSSTNMTTYRGIHIPSARSSNSNDVKTLSPMSSPRPARARAMTLSPTREISAALASSPLSTIRPKPLLRRQTTGSEQQNEERANHDRGQFLNHMYSIRADYSRNNHQALFRRELPPVVPPAPPLFTATDTDTGTDRGVCDNDNTTRERRKAMEPIVEASCSSLNMEDSFGEMKVNTCNGTTLQHALAQQQPHANNQNNDDGEAQQSLAKKARSAKKLWSKVKKSALASSLHHGDILRRFSSDRDSSDVPAHSDDKIGVDSLVVKTASDAKCAAILQRLFTGTNSSISSSCESEDDSIKPPPLHVNESVKTQSQLSEPSKPAPQSQLSQQQQLHQRPSLSQKEPSSYSLYSHQSHTSGSLLGNVPSKRYLDTTGTPDYGGFTGLRQLCNAPILDGRVDPQWRRVRDYLRRLSPSEARIAAETREGSDEETALHLACRQKPPADVIRMLLQASPLPAFWATLTKLWLPLHYECSHGGATNEDVVRLLLTVNPDAVESLDRWGRNPLHLVTEQPTSHSPSFTSLRCLMTPNVVNTKSKGHSEDSATRQNGTQDGQLKRPFLFRKKTTTEQAKRYPLTIEYLVSKASKLMPDQSYERSCALSCLKLFLDSKTDSLQRPSDTECVAYIQTLEDSPEWFQGYAGAHPYVQAILNLKISEGFSTAVLMMDFYVLIALIISFRMLTDQSLSVRFDNHAHNITSLVGGDDDDADMDGPKRWGFLKFLFKEQNTARPLSIMDSSLVQMTTPLIAKHMNLFGPVIFGYLGVFYLLAREILQMISLVMDGNFDSWLFDIWNYLDVTCISLVGASVMQMHRGTGEDGTIRLLSVLTTGVLWMRILSFLKLTRREFAIFVSGIVHVTLTLQSFLFTLCIFLAAYSQMYSSNFQGTDRCKRQSDINDGIQHDFCSAKGAYLKVYMMMVGGGVDESDFTFDRTALWLSITFAFMVVILLLNVLIAIVTDSYQEVKQHGEIVFWSHRLSFVYEVLEIARLFKTMFGRHDDELVDNSNTDVEEDDESEQGHNLSVLFKPKTVPLTFSDNLQTLWEICLVTYENPTVFGVFLKKVELRKRWKGPTWILGSAVNPIVQPDKASPDFKLAFLFALGIPVWMVAGVLTAGILWPPQVRRWLLCPSIIEENDRKQNAAKEDVTDMGNDVREEVRKVEQLIDTQLLDIGQEIKDVKETIENIQVGMEGIRALLVSILENDRQGELALPVECLWNENNNLQAANDDTNLHNVVENDNVPDGLPGNNGKMDEFPHSSGIRSGLTQRRSNVQVEDIKLFAGDV